MACFRAGVSWVRRRRAFYGQVLGAWADTSHPPPTLADIQRPWTATEASRFTSAVHHRSHYQCLERRDLSIIITINPQRDQDVPCAPTSLV